MRLGRNSFYECINKTQNYLKELKKKALVDRNKLEDVPQCGVYVFYENGKPFYVGRSNRMKQCIQEHGRGSSGRYSATLAFRMAIKSVGIKKEELKSIKRGELEKAPGFEKEFFLMRKRIAEMQVRTVEIKDQIEQTLFEVYAALKLDTVEYNDFSTH